MRRLFRISRRPRRGPRPGLFGCGQAQCHRVPRPHSEPARSRFLTTTNLLTIPSPTTFCPSVQVWCLKGACTDRHHRGFTIHSQARQDSRPNRVHRSYGLVVHLGLLPTSSHEGAVSSGYKAPDRPWQGLSPCWFIALEGARVRRFIAALVFSPFGLRLPH